MNLSQYIIKKLISYGAEHCFTVTGGAAMFLNDAIGSSNGLIKTYCHHEQSASIAAEVYARIKKKPAILNITAGPGVLNSLNGVFGAFTDSVPMIVLSGQAKKQTSLQFNKIKNLRQLGDQELKTLDIVKTITKKQYLIKSQYQIDKIIFEAYHEAISGRPGPVWLDIPIDVQSEKIKKQNNNIRAFVQKKKYTSSFKDIKKVLRFINNSNRPLVLSGTGIKISSSEKNLKKFLKLYKLPLVTAWCHDVITNNFEYYIGRQGTIGTRAGNFATQNCDLLIVLGSRLNIRQVSYNYKKFAKNAKIIWVDIDKYEFKKNFIKSNLNIQSDLNDFLKKMIKQKNKFKIKNFNKWLNWCKHIKINYNPKYEDYSEYNDINPYHLIHSLFKELKDGDIVVCADATATIVPFQIGQINKKIHLISNSGCATMGYEFPGLIGALMSNKKSRIICLAGDGSSMMNLQDLSIIKKFEKRVKIFLLNNDGYLSIKQTQRNFFGKEFGASSESGLYMPNFMNIAKSFGLKSYLLKKNISWKKQLKNIMSSNKYSFIEVKLATEQEFQPRLKSKKIHGKIVTPELDNMFPFLDDNELQNIRKSAKKIIT